MSLHNKTDGVWENCVPENVHSVNSELSVLSLTTSQALFQLSSFLSNSLTLRSPVPGKYSPYLWNETVITRSVV